MTSKHITNCPNCFETIKKTSCYEKHILQCQRTNDLSNFTSPSNKQLYEIIVNLTEKYNKLQTEVDGLKKQLYVKNKKLDVLSWLNVQTLPTNSFHVYMEHISIDVEKLTYIFDENLTTGILRIVCEFLEETDAKYSIKCYDQKKNILYVFNGEMWTEFTAEEFRKTINKVYSKCLQGFDMYKNKNEEKMKTDSDFQEEYTKKFMKLINTKPSFDTICGRIKNKLYIELKESFTSITEFEI